MCKATKKTADGRFFLILISAMLVANPEYKLVVHSAYTG